jgi:hypothetical protein
MCFTDQPIGEAMEWIHAYAERVDDSGLARVQLAAPFAPTIPGTDFYADRLWPE